MTLGWFKRYRTATAKKGTGFARALIICWTLLCVGSPAEAIEPEHKIGNWFGATSALRFSDKWSLFLQGELRTWEPVNNLNEVLWRIGGHYDVNKENMAAFSYVRVDTWPYQDTGLLKFHENRLYEEWLIKKKWGSGKLNHRFRLEQRWITTPEFGTGYSNRARYMLQYTKPLGSDTLKSGVWFIKALNEVFVDFDKNGYWFGLEGRERGLNQNRLYFGGGKQLTPLSNFRVGVLWQHRPSADFWRLVFAYSHNFDFRKEEN